MQEKKAVEIKALSKDFNSLKAVNAISFDINEQEIFGLLGPNGAGKTTTISMLCTILQPSSGTAILFGHDVKDEPNEVRQKIGLVFQDPSLDEELTAEENLEFHARLYNVPADEEAKRIDEMLELVGLSDKKKYIVKTFSGGMKRRLEIARGLLHNPKVLFLDEPTLGLDPQTRSHIWEHIRKLNKTENVTIVLTTHYLEEADQLCDRVAIIDHGEIKAIGKPEDLKAALGGDIITFETKSPERIEKTVKKLKFVKKAMRHDGYLTVHVENADKNLFQLMKSICDEKIGSMTVRKPSLEDVFLKHTGRTIREAESGSGEQMKELVRRRLSR